MLVTRLTVPMQGCGLCAPVTVEEKGEKRKLKPILQLTIRGKIEVFFGKAPSKDTKRTRSPRSLI